MSDLPTWYRRVFSYPVVLGAALMAVLLIFAVTLRRGQLMTDPDIWWHLANAQHLMTTGHFIRQDTYSFTVRGVPWVNIEWLAELPYYFAFRCLGERGIFLMMLAICEAILVGIYLLCYLRSRDVKASFVAALLAVPMMTVSLAPRTLLFGWLLLIAELAILWLYRNGRDYTWLLAPVFALWINAHGSWFLGFVLMLIFIGSGFLPGRWGGVESLAWTTAQKRKLLLVTAVTFAALFLNPYGWRLVMYPLNFASQQAIIFQSVSEWATLDFHGLRGKFFLAVLFGLGALNVFRKRTWLLPDLLFALIVIYGAVTYTRFVFLAGIVLCPFLAMDLRGLLAVYDSKQERPTANVVVLAALAAFVFWQLPTAAAVHEGIAANFPEQALPRLRQLPANVKVFNAFDWGGYLIWNTPQLPDLVDGRTDIFANAGVMKDYTQAIAGNGTFEVFDRYGIQYVLFPKAGPMVYMLRRSPHWKLSYEDRNAMLFERVSSTHAQ